MSMGNRLSKLYTKTGDDGTTGLADGSRVNKNSARIHAFGDIDELNCLIGRLVADEIDEDIKSDLLDIQHILFDLGGELAIPASVVIDEVQERHLERLIDRYNAPLSPLKEFILPGGSVVAAICHQARAVCRRAERWCVALSQESGVNPVSLRLLNRLSDLLFVMARTLAQRDGGGDVLWRSERLKK